MRRLCLPVAAAGSLALLTACAVPPSAPTVMALPPQGKPFEAFQQDDLVCRGFAAQQSGGGQAAQAANNTAVGGAVLGTALGAGAGALIGAAAGNPAAGAAIGAGTGLVVGSAAGTGQAGWAVRGAQAQFDTAYTQCMYSKGNSVQSAPTGYAGYPGPYPTPYYPYGYAPAIYGPGIVVGGWYGHGWGGYHRHW